MPGSFGVQVLRVLLPSKGELTEIKINSPWEDLVEAGRMMNVPVDRTNRGNDTTANRINLYGDILKAVVNTHRWMKSWGLSTGDEPPLAEVVTPKPQKRQPAALKALRRKTS